MPVDHAETWRRAKRILCVRLDTLGDVLMTGPAIRALKESSGQEPVSAGLGRAGENGQEPVLAGLGHGKAARPGALGSRAGEIVGENAQESVLAGSVQGKNAHPALGSRAGEIAGEMVVKRHITLLTSPAGAVAARLMPEIDEVIVYEAPWMKATAHRHTSRPDLEMADRLRHEAFDAAVIFTVYSQNPLPAAFLCYLADIPLRLASCRENPYQLLTNWVRETEPDTCLRHEVRRQLDLVATVGARTKDERLSVEIPESAGAMVDDLLRDLIDRTRKSWIVIHPGATAASRRYSAENFATVARRLVQDLDCQVIFTGTDPEHELVEQIRDMMAVPSQSLTGALSLADFAALLARAPLLISNNTGAVHVAAAVGTPVVDLYALTNPQHTPWQVPHRVLFQDVPCKYCYKSVCPEGHHNCLRLVAPETVVEAAAELLDGAPAGMKSEGLRFVYPGY